MTNLTHSYSALKLYENCPLRYYRQRIKKDVVDKGGPASIVGDRQHKHIEVSIADDVPLPPELSKFSPVIATLTKKADEGWGIYPEQELALTQWLKPTGWWDEDVWFRGKLDVLAISPCESKAVVLDWKTGKRRPDMFQLEIFAAMVFSHYKSVQKVRTSLVWLKDEAIDSLDVTREERGFIWQKILERTKRIHKSVKTDVWPAKPSGLCPYCPARNTCNYAY